VVAQHLFKKTDALETLAVPVRESSFFDGEKRAAKQLHARKKMIS